MGNNFIFGYVSGKYCICNKINLNPGGSYIASPEWLKNKKAAINSKNNDEILFQYEITVALNHEKIEKTPQNVKRIQPFSN